MRSKTAFICGVLGLIGALAFLSPLFIPAASLLGWMIGPLPLYAAGMAFGLPGALIAGLSGSAALALYGGFSLIAGYVVMFAGPVVLTVAWLMRVQRAEDGSAMWASASEVLVRLIWLGVLAVLATALVFAGAPDGLRGVLAAVIAGEPQMQDLLSGWPGDQQDITQLIQAMVPGAMIAGLLLLLIGNAAAAQALLGGYGRLVRPPVRLADIELPRWMATAFAIALFAWLATSSASLVGWYAGHVLWVFLTGYVIAGLAVIHALARQSSMRIVILVVTYFLVLVTPAVLIVGGIGLFEPWVRMRGRFGHPNRHSEDE